MKGPCMCGAIDCTSCGPAQGYHPCEACGGYRGDCGHYDEDTGELNDDGVAEQSKHEAAQEWAWEQRLQTQREDLGLDPRDYAYWDKLM